MNRTTIRMAAQRAGFTDLIVDAVDPHTGILIQQAGAPQRVFLRVARNASRLAVEQAALELVQQCGAGRIPVPRVVGALQVGTAGVLLLSYEAGANLADLLPERPDAPPLPPTYVRQAQRPADDLSDLLVDLGQAVKALHTIHVDAFGKFVGDEPNPHRAAAQPFTWQEALHRLQRCEDQGWLDRVEARRIEQWLAGHLPLIREDEPPAFVHYDLHPGNIRITQRTVGSWSLRALLDWEVARAWLPEYDLAMLSWYLRGASDAWWDTFLHGYGHGGPAVWERLHLFEMIKALGAMAYSQREAAWGQWCQRRAMQLLDLTTS